MELKHYAFDPNGKIILETESDSEEGCFQWLQEHNIHTPYDTVEELQHRGYEIKEVKKHE